ncbi:MAG: ABC transporter ATP-binding protein [bacterium]|nr:ABC transporter ATP-binding protein [bacterium]
MLKEFQEILLGLGRISSLLERGEKRALLLALCIMVGTGFLANLPAVLLGQFVDKIINVENPTFSIAIPFLGLIIAAILVRESLTVLRKYLVENVATQTEKKQTVRTIDRLLKTDLDFITKNRIGALHGRIFRSIQGLVRLLKLGFLDFFPAFFAALTALAIAFYQKPSLASFMILVIPAGLFIVVKQIASQKGIRVSLLRGKEDVDAKVVEMMGGLETIRVSNTSGIEIGGIEQIAERLRKIEIKHHISMAFYDAAKYLNEAFFYVLVVSVAVYFAVTGVITEGDILMYSILFMSVISPLREIHRILDEAHESSIRVQDLYELQHEPMDISFEAKGSIRKDAANIVEIRDLSFNYDETEKRVLSNLNLTIKRGEKIGLVGASGHGKTTLIKILLRLVHNYEGEVFLFGKDLQEVTREEVAARIAYIPQKSYVFRGTILENITYGCSRKVSTEEVQEAARRANILEEIQTSLGGFEGFVAEIGNNLSGGQKQRLALARLMLESPELLILDEATSALDNTNEAIVQKNLEAAFSGATVITIAHRLTTLRNADRILVFQEGAIVQEGTYRQLSQKDGAFKEFLKQQPGQG